MARRMSDEEFERRGKLLHGPVYDYSGVIYISSKVKVSLKCIKHNTLFSTTRDNHLHNKGGCPLCRYEKSTLTQSGNKEEFSFRGVERYGSRFNYSFVEYINARTNVKIICNEHNTTFYQTPEKHLNGVGCGKCVRNGYNREKPGYLYALVCDNMVKIGITNRDIATRAKEISKDFGRDFDILYSDRFVDGNIAYDTEFALLKLLRKTYLQPVAKFDGSTECFLNVDYPSLIELIDTEIEKVQRKSWQLTPPQILEDYASALQM